MYLILNEFDEVEKREELTEEDIEFFDSGSCNILNISDPKHPKKAIGFDEETVDFSPENLIWEEI